MDDGHPRKHSFMSQPCQGRVNLSSEAHIIVPSYTRVEIVQLTLIILSFFYIISTRGIWFVLVDGREECSCVWLWVKSSDCSDAVMIFIFPDGCCCCGGVVVVVIVVVVVVVVVADPPPSRAALENASRWYDRLLRPSPDPPLVTFVTCLLRLLYGLEFMLTLWVLTIYRKALRGRDSSAAWRRWWLNSWT